MLEIRDLSAGYPGKPVLDRVNLDLPEGGVTVLLGPNGCGKSTLLKALCGVLSVTGTVRFGSLELSALTDRERARQVAYLPQDRPAPDIPARLLVLHGRFPYLGYPRRYRAEDYAAADEALARMGIAHLADTPVRNLSGGQRQKVCIAMALAQDTPIILLDEPTTYLDIRHQLELMAQVRALRSAGKTVLMVLHDLESAFQLADRVVLMEHGRIAAQGDPEAVFSSGRLDDVFGVKVRRVQVGDRRHYYCEEGEP